MRAVRISPKHARTLLSLAKKAADGATFSEWHSAVEALEKALDLKPALRERRKVKAGKKAAKREATSEVRKLVAIRAGMICECGCHRWFRGFDGAAQMDHFEGVARSESVETCWLLRADCHAAKTSNSPSAAHWLEKFICHAAGHGYAEAEKNARDRLASIGLVKEAASLSEPKHISTVDLVGDGVAAKTWRSFQKGGG